MNIFGSLITTFEVIHIFGAAKTTAKTYDHPQIKSIKLSLSKSLKHNLGLERFQPKLCLLSR